MSFRKLSFFNMGKHGFHGHQNTHLGGSIEFKISSVCCRFLASIGCSFRDDGGLAIGIEVSAGCGDVVFKAFDFP